MLTYRERYQRWYERKKAGLVAHTGAGRKHGEARPIDPITDIPIQRVKIPAGHEQDWKVEPFYWQK